MKKAAGGLYINQKTQRRQLAVYNFRHDVQVYPFSLQAPLREPVAHLVYDRKSKQGAVDVYDLEQGEPIPETVNINKTITISARQVSLDSEKAKVTGPLSNLRGASKLYNIGGEVKGYLPSETRRFIENAVLADVVIFCGEDVAKIRKDKKIEYVDSIIPTTPVKEVRPTKLIDGGKQWFVPICGLEGNIDFALGCSTSWVPLYPKASFNQAERTFTGFVSVPWAECSYCYSEDKHKIFPQGIYKMPSRKRLEELIGGECRIAYDSDEPLGRPLQVLRIGKRTEPGAPLLRDKLVLTQEAMLKYKGTTSGVLTTKALEFDKELAKLFKRTNTFVIYGMGVDPKFEEGAIMQGMTDEFKNEQMLKFREQRVFCLPYLHIFAGRPPRQSDLAYLEFLHKRGIPSQLLPIRFATKNLSREMTGERWKTSSKQRSDSFELEGILGNEGYYFYEGSLTSFVHKDWLKIIGDNNGRVRMCHHNGDYTYCGGCFHKKGVIIPTVHVEKLSHGHEKRGDPEKERKKMEKKKGWLKGNNWSVTS